MSKMSVVAERALLSFDTDPDSKSTHNARRARAFFLHLKLTFKIASCDGFFTPRHISAGSDHDAGV